jgi:hypothetical protein
MTRDEWAAKVADAVIEIAVDAEVRAVAVATEQYTPPGNERHRLRRELIFLLSERPE